MIAIAELIARLEPIEGGWRGCIPDGWLQGRTSYGGLSSALALHAAQMSDTDLPPVRSAQLTFVGPLAGAVTIRAQRVRRGRNAAFVKVDVESEAGLGLRATFVFMGAIASPLVHCDGLAPGLPAPAREDGIRLEHDTVRFIQNFDHVDRPHGLAPAEWLRWVRLAERDGLDPMVELIAVADCLPPAATKLLRGPVPVSSVTWLLNLLTPAPVTTDGWWLLQSRADHAEGGSSSQVMRIWNADGVAIAEQMQSVAIFA